MADPVIAVILYAETRGFITLKDYSPAPSWQAGARLRLRAARAEIERRAAELALIWHTAAMHVPGVDTSQGMSNAREAFERCRAAVKPWLKKGEAQKGDDLDLVALWYIINTPERLQELGVNFGEIKPVSG